jgi:hypothetical protein
MAFFTPFPRDTFTASCPLPAACYFASGFGRSWNFTALLCVPLPPSMWVSARVA